MTDDRIEVVVADITTLKNDAIVNAANSTLLGGGGVDGAIHRAAGPALLEECRGLQGCPAGEARLTGGYALSAAHVIHTVGPIWSGGGRGEDELLAACYRSSLGLAAGVEVHSLAFPAISTGAYGFPKERAAKIAVREVRSWLEGHEHPERVTFCCFSEADGQVLRAALGKA